MNREIMEQSHLNINSEIYKVRTLPVNPWEKTLDHRTPCPSRGRTKSCLFIWFWANAVRHSKTILSQINYLDRYVADEKPFPSYCLTTFQVVSQLISLALLEVDDEAGQPQAPIEDNTPSLLDYGASICTFKPSFKPFKA